MASRAVSQSEVLRALAECEGLGEEVFLAKYGYGPAKDYFVVHNDKRYPSKAIYGVAHRFIEPDGRAMRNDEFSGGDAEVARPLRALGFEVTAPEDRNPKWSRDEVILALAFYMACNGNPPDKGSAAILALSDELNRLGRILHSAPGTTFRNPNGVYMKLMNLRSLDPRFQASGRVGLASASRTDRAVFEEYWERPVDLEAAAAAIRKTIASKVWLIGCPGFDPTKDGAFGFTPKADRDKFFEQTDELQYCCVWGLDDEETPPELRNRLLGLALVERTPVDWYTKLAPDIVETLVGTGRAEENRFAAPIRRAWKIIDPPRADALINSVSKRIDESEFFDIGAWFPHSDVVRLLGSAFVREVNVYGEDQTWPKGGSEPRRALDVLGLSDDPSPQSWVFVCNPKRWAVDEFLDRGIEIDTWSVRPSDAAKFAPGQRALLRVGVDKRTIAERRGRPPLKAGIYAVCQVLSAAYPSAGGSDEFWSPGEDRAPGWPTVDVQYLRTYKDKPLSIEAISAVLPQVSKHLLEGLQAATFPIPASDFASVMTLLEPQEVPPGPGSSSGLAEAIREVEARNADATPEVKERKSRHIERGPAGDHAKRLNGFKCQLCEALKQPPHSFKKPNGTPYVEAHHVMPVSKLVAGSLGLSNIMTVCANHHRQLHFGCVEVVIQDEVFAVTLDGTELNVPRFALS